MDTHLLIPPATGFLEPVKPASEKAPGYLYSIFSDLFKALSKIFSEPTDIKKLTKNNATLLPSSLTSATSQPTPLSQPIPKSQLLSFFGETLSDYESNVLLDKISNDAKLPAILDKAITNPELAKEEFQELLNEQISSCDILKIAFFRLVHTYKTSDMKTLLKLVAEWVIDLFIDPIKFVVSAVKTIAIKEDRDKFIDKVKELALRKPLSYQDRKRFLTFLLELGISGLIASTVGAVIFSGGIAVIPLAIFGGITAGAIGATVVSDQLENKSLALTAGELLGTSSKTAVSATITSIAWGSLFKIPHLSDKILNPTSNSYSYLGTSTSFINEVILPS